MENDPVTVEPVQRLDRQMDFSSNHEEIQESRRKAQDTVQFQSADVYHDLEKSLQNLEVVEHVEGETSENNHDQREESQNLHAYENNGQEISAEANHDLENRLQNLEVVEHVEREKTENNHDQREESQNLHAHENNGQEIGATGGYSAFSRVQPEEADDLQFLEMITEKEDTDGMFNTCTIDTILTIMAVLQLKIGKIHDFFKNSNHRIYKANSKLPQLLRDKCISDMRRLIGKRLDSRDYADDINNLLQQYVIKEEFVTDCAKCGFRRWDDVKEVVNCKDYRAKDTNCIPDQMHENPPKFFRERLRYYLNFFFLHNNSSTGETAYCQNCRSKRKITYTVEGSDGNPSPLFIVMLPIDGSTESGHVIWEDVVKDISPLCCFNYEYVVGAVIVFIENPNGSETSSNYSESSDNQEQRPGIIADTDDELLGHYIGHVYIVNPEYGDIIKKYKYCNSKGIKEVREFEEEGDCVTFLLFRTK